MTNSELKNWSRILPNMCSQIRLELNIGKEFFEVFSVFISVFIFTHKYGVIG